MISMKCIPKIAVGTVRKSGALILLPWFSRNVHTIRSYSKGYPHSSGKGNSIPARRADGWPMACCLLVPVPTTLAEGCPVTYRIVAIFVFVPVLSNRPAGDQYSARFARARPLAGRLAAFAGCASAISLPAYPAELRAHCLVIPIVCF